jgi:two-component system cell cycle response regulator
MTEIFPGDSGSLPILVVEDNLLMRKILEGHLRDLGHSVVVAENGRHALELMNKAYFPIVITDLVMPEMDGMELCRAIRSAEYPGYVYVVLLTSQDAKEDLIKGLDAGADEYLVKPVSPSELAVRLKTARRIHKLESSLKESYEEIKVLSTKDALTRIFNRGYLDERLPQEVKRAFRFERSLSVIMFDIDHFKKINDTFGHQIGDQVLRDCADCVSRGVRGEIDWLARYGGEEFVIVLPETMLAGAMIAAERLRVMMAEWVTVVGGKKIRFTASFGVASFTPPDQKEDPSMARTLIEKADQCLYQAKKEGRNRVKGLQL